MGIGRPLRLIRGIGGEKIRRRKSRVSASLPGSTRPGVMSPLVVLAKETLCREDKLYILSINIGCTVDDRPGIVVMLSPPSLSASTPAWVVVAPVKLPSIP